MIDQGRWLDRLLWSLIIFVSGYVGSQLQGATISINELNQKMAIVITSMGNQGKSIEDHEIRIRSLEITRARK